MYSYSPHIILIAKYIASSLLHHQQKYSMGHVPPCQFLRLIIPEDLNNQNLNQLIFLFL